jgi:hypothetical protein
MSRRKVAGFGAVIGAAVMCMVATDYSVIRTPFDASTTNRDSRAADTGD